MCGTAAFIAPGNGTATDVWPNAVTMDLLSSQTHLKYKHTI